MVLCSRVAYVLTALCFLSIECEEVNREDGPNTEPDSRITYPNDFLLPEEPDYHHHHHHHHHPSSYHDQRDFAHFRLLENPKREEDEEGYIEIPAIPPETEQYVNSSMQIPVEFIRNINKYNVSDLLLNFVEEETVITSRFGEDDDGARNSAKIPKAAGCSPELKTIMLAKSEDPSILYIPQCTKIERCGGCCSHTLLSCQPKETETLTYQVMKTQYTGEKKLKFLGKEIIVIEKHISCKCDCKVKEEMCNKYQEYRESECRCACTNTDEEKKCYKNSAKKLWNPELCACQCRDVIQCTTGYSFDHIECRCTANPKRRFANYERRGYVSEASEVSPLVDDEY